MIMTMDEGESKYYHVDCYDIVFKKEEKKEDDNSDNDNDNITDITDITIKRQRENSDVYFNIFQDEFGIFKKLKPDD